MRFLYIDTNPAKSLIATGDDYGNVNLFRFPASQERSNFSAFKAHSSHVVTVRFSAKGTFLFSSGGVDKAIIQWRVHA